MDDKKEVPISQIIITFQEPGSVNLQLEVKNVIPLQAIAAACFSKNHAEAGFIQQQMAQQKQAEMNRIALPNQ